MRIITTEATLRKARSTGEGEKLEGSREGVRKKGRKGGREKRRYFSVSLGICERCKKTHLGIIGI